MLRTLTFFVISLCACTQTARSKEQAVPDAGSSALLEAKHPNEVRFVAIGDTGKGNDGQRRVGAAIAEHCKTAGCDFVVLLGDNFYPSGVSSTSDPQWQSAFVVPYASVDAPFYAVLGNHDYGGNGAGTNFLLGNHQVAYSKVNPKWRMPNHHYHWRLGEVEFFAADTNRSMFGLDAAERTDFTNWLSSSTAKWKIVFGHHPYKSSGPHGNAGNYDGLALVPIADGTGVKSFLEDVFCGRVDFYFSGHDHNIQWLESTCSKPGAPLETQLVISGGGAATNPISQPLPAHYQSDELGFVYVVIHDNTLTASFHDSTGIQRYTRTVAK